MDDSSPRKTIALKIFDIEHALEFIGEADPAYSEAPIACYLDLTSGQLKWPEGDDDLEEFWEDDNLLALPEDLSEKLDYDSMEEFATNYEDEKKRQELLKAIKGSGAVRRFKDVVFGGGDVALKHAWNWYQTRTTRERIVEWFHEHGIEPEWDCDIFEPPTYANKRPALLAAVVEFVEKASQLDGVQRIALLGSLTTNKPIPKDVDLLVEVSDTMHLSKLAQFRRALSGKTMSTGDSCGADVFLCNSAGAYLGRVCEWKRCEPFVRQACQAKNCGQRKFLYDDLHNVKLDSDLIQNPPLQLWPSIDARIELPDDVSEGLVIPLKRLNS